MAQTIHLNPQSKPQELEENAFIEFIKKERIHIINKVKADFPDLKEETVEDIFQEVCLSLINKLNNGNLELRGSLFSYFYKSCWYQAKDAYSNQKKMAPLPERENIKSDLADGDGRPIMEDKIDQLLNMLVPDEDEREMLLEDVKKEVKALPEPCNKILFWIYGNKKVSSAEIAKKCGYKDATVVRTTAVRCKDKFRKKFESIYEDYKKKL